MHYHSVHSVDVMLLLERSAFPTSSFNLSLTLSGNCSAALNSKPRLQPGTSQAVNNIDLILLSFSLVPFSVALPKNGLVYIIVWMLFVQLLFAVYVISEKPK